MKFEHGHSSMGTIDLKILINTNNSLFNVVPTLLKRVVAAIIAADTLSHMDLLFPGLERTHSIFSHVVHSRVKCDAKKVVKPCLFECFSDVILKKY